MSASESSMDKGVLRHELLCSEDLSANKNKKTQRVISSENTKCLSTKCEGAKINMEEISKFFETFNFAEVIFVLKKLEKYRKFFETEKEKEVKKNVKYIRIVDIDDPEFPDMYKIMMDDRKPSKYNEIGQNGKFYNVIYSIEVPFDSEYKTLIRSLTKKLPEKGRMKYNYTFHKDRLDEIIKALEKK